MKNWNKRNEPISERLRDDIQIHYVNNNHTLMYNPRTQETGLILDVFVVDIELDTDVDEDRFVEYTVADDLRKDWSVDLDDDCDSRRQRQMCIRDRTNNRNEN